MKEIVLFVGPRGSGKDYNCNLLVQEGYRRLSFADGLRELTWMALGWSPKNEQEYDQFKTDLIQLRTKGTLAHHELTGRDFLINIGDGMRNKVDPLIWINMVLKKIKDSSHDKFCISDCRYTNEILELSYQYDVRVIFTNYKSPRYHIDDTTDSEWLPNRLLELGYDDGHEVSTDLIHELHKKFKERK